MVFSSMTFLFAFLPVVVLVYMLSPKQMKNAILLIASLFFYAWGEPRNILLMLLSIGINYVFGRIIEADRASQSKMRVWNLGFAVLWNVLILGIFKYVSGISQTLHAMLPSLIPVVKIALPIGISFYTFQAISYLVDVYRGTTRAQNNLINFALYIAMFPQLIAGPIVRYEDVEQQIRSRKVTIAGFGVGCEFFIRGMVKKVLFANLLGQIFVRIQALSNVQSSMVTAWIGAILYTLQIYYDFSGYSDMAIGLGRMFGFRFPQNFNYPYIAESITDFWRRWHITLGAWFKDYIFYPISLGTHFQKFSQNCRKHMNRYYAATIPGIFALFAVWFGNGIWHGAEWKYIIYGLYYYVIMVLGMLLEPAFVSFCSKLNIDRNASWYHTMQVVRTFILVNIGMLIFRSKDIKTAITMLGSVFQPWHGKSNFWQLAFNRGGLFKLDFLLIAFSVILLYFIGKKQENGHSIRELILAQPLPIRWAIYIIPIVLIIIAGAYGPGWGVADFIYAKF